MRKLGVSVTLLAAGEIVPNLEKGVIDGTEFSMPSIDKAMGFQKIAKNYYFPGWHQPSSTAELIINKKFWYDLPKHNQAQIEVACKANIAWEIARGDGEQAKPKEDLSDEDVHRHTLTDEATAAIRKAPKEVQDDEDAAVPAYHTTRENAS